MHAAEDPAVPRFAKRRPDWNLPELHNDLCLQPFDALQSSPGRQPCPKCNRSKFLYCYDCLVPFTAVPKLEIPFKVSIITHREESRSKNTGVHAAILAPEQVELHSLDECPDFDAAHAYVLFPSDDAVEVEDVDVSRLQRLFIIDSRWKKARELVKHPSIANLPRIKLRDTRSAFWRFHTRGVSDEGVCTIEALYFLLQRLCLAGKYQDYRYTNGHYFDNLLWYFVYQHQLIAQAAEKRYEEKLGAQEPTGPPPKQQKCEGAEKGPHALAVEKRADASAPDLQPTA